jgi:ethanolamine ammonia-lyase small subunit
MDHDLNLVSSAAWPEIIRKIRERTPARIFVERNAAYGTQMSLELRGAHASAVDAVWTEFDIQEFPAEFVSQWGLFQVSTQAESKARFLLRPDLGRNLTEDAKTAIARHCPKGVDLQVVIGDGLSKAAVCAQVPALLPLLQEQVREHGWSIGQPFAVRYCRVGAMNDIGDLLSPQVLVLLIGERPGLATAESLSAYMAYRPCSGQTDADRNLISNIHFRGVRVEDAAARIVNLAAQMMTAKLSGTAVKEQSTGRLP